jgi:hypothetical protein
LGKKAKQSFGKHSSKTATNQPLPIHDINHSSTTLPTTKPNLQQHPSKAETKPNHHNNEPKTRRQQQHQTYDLRM